VRKRKLVYIFDPMNEGLHWNAEWIEIQTLGQIDNYPLTYKSRAVVSSTWLAPWTPDFLKEMVPLWKIQYFELDVSFEALGPMCYCIPTAISHNIGIPLGLIITPTERTETYRLFIHMLERIDRSLIETVIQKPLLSDQGTALKSFANEFEIVHFLCFRHLLELLGSRTFVSLLARRLLFTGSEEEYNKLKQPTFQEFGCAVRMEAITEHGKSVFCGIFGLSMDPTGRVEEIDAEAFPRQALWGGRLAQGVSACTNHVEGLHARLNEAVRVCRLLTRKISVIVNTLKAKVSDAHRNPFRSAKQKLFDMKSGKAQQKATCDCGWSAIYSARFGLEDYPCYHTVEESKVQFPNLPKIPINWESPTEIRHTTYQGEPWNVHTESRRPRPIGSEVENFVQEDGLRGFVERLRNELQVIWPGVQLDSFELAADFGSLVQERRQRGLKGDGSEIADPQLRTEFELRCFKKASESKRH
jgi:hypothetical protein